MIQKKQIGLILGIINRIDAFKLLQGILYSLTFLTLVFILIFTGMFGHIIADELQQQRKQVVQALDEQNCLLREIIKNND